MIGSFWLKRIGMRLIVFTKGKEAINHANGSELMSANTLVFIRNAKPRRSRPTWRRGRQSPGTRDAARLSRKLELGERKDVSYDAGTYFQVTLDRTMNLSSHGALFKI